MHLVLTWPVDHDRRPTPSGVPIFSYVLSSSFGGATTGAALGGLASLAALAGLSPGSLLLGALPIILLAAWQQTRGVVALLPERKAQVPRTWLLWRHRTLTAAGFGFLIGAGVFTYLRHATAWTLAVLCLAAPSFGTAVLLGTVYGAARSLPLIVTWGQDRLSLPRVDWGRAFGPRARAATSLAPLSVVTYLAATALLSGA
jgi:hypothetical protein